MSIQVVSFNCLLKNKIGQVISSTFNREVLTTAVGQDLILSGLSKGLQNLSKGEKRVISVRAEEAYGLYDPKKVILYPAKKLPRNLRAGDSISIAGKSGKIRLYRVLQFHDEMVSLDGNHPLAGQDLVFEIETLEVREATPEEIADSSNVVATQVLH